MAFNAAELTKDGQLNITGNINTRLPAVTDGLVAHYPFDGILEPSIENFSISHHFPLVGNLSNTVGDITLTRTGGALFADGIGYIINAPTNFLKLSRPIGYTNISIEFYYTCDGFNSPDGWNTLLCRDGGDYHHILINGDSHEIGFYNRAFYSSGFVIETGIEYHIKLIKRGAISILYIDGVEVQYSENSFDNAAHPLSIIGNYMSYSVVNQGAIGTIRDIKIGTSKYNEVFEKKILLCNHSDANRPVYDWLISKGATVTVQPVGTILSYSFNDVKNYDMIVFDYFAWSIESHWIDKIKYFVDSGISVYASGNDTRTNYFVSAYDTSAPQAVHTIEIDKNSCPVDFGFTSYPLLDSSDLVGGIQTLSNFAFPLYKRTDANLITGYIYQKVGPDSRDRAVFIFDQDGIRAGGSNIEDVVGPIIKHCLSTTKTNTTNTNLTYDGITIEGPTTNLLTNGDCFDKPSLNGTGSLTRILLEFGRMRDKQAMKIIANSQDASDDCYYQFGLYNMNNLVMNTSYTLSMDMFIPQDVNLNNIWFGIWHYNGTTWVAERVIVNNISSFKKGQWNRVSTTTAIPSSGITMIMGRIELRYGVSNKGKGIYVSNVQWENKPFATSFVNGSRANKGEFKIKNPMSAPFTFAFNFIPITTNDYRTSINWVFTLTPYTNDFLMWKRSEEDYYRIRINGSDCVFNASEITANNKYHIAIATTSTETKIYLNGDLKNTFASSAVIGDTINLGSRDTYVSGNNIFSNLSLYNRALSEDEIKQLVSPTFELKSNGDLIASQIISKPNIPQDAIYFPLGCDAKDEYKIITPTTELNTVYEDGACWVGSATTNLLANKYNTSQIMSPLTGQLSRLITLTHGGGTPLADSGYIGGLSSGVYYTISFTAWCDNGPDIQIRNDFFPDSLPEQYPTVSTVPEKYTWTTASTHVDWTTNVAVRFFHYNTGRTIYITDVQLEQKPYATPYVNGTRAVTQLYYSPTLINCAQNFTIFGWYNLNTFSTSAYEGLIAHDDGGVGTDKGGRFLVMGNTSENRIRWWYGNGTYEESLTTNAPDFVVGQWCFFAVRRNGSTTTLFDSRNGVLYSASKTNGAYLDTMTYVNPWRFGMWSTGQPANGYIRDYGFVQRAMSDEEINNMFNDKMLQLNDGTLQIQNSIRTGQVL